MTSQGPSASGYHAQGEHSTWSRVPVISGILLALQLINVTSGSDVILCFVPDVCSWV